jgi:ABC-type glutathione transport system ATPase component
MSLPNPRSWRISVARNATLEAYEGVLCRLLEILGTDGFERMTKASNARNGTLLRVTDLKVHFPIRRGLFGRQAGVVKAVDGVSFVIDAAESFGVVGESGCGKSTVGNAVLRMVEPTSGSVEFDGQAMNSRISSVAPHPPPCRLFSGPGHR